jgi:hypothetical protein
MYADFSTGILIGVMIAIFVSATLWAILFHQVQEIRGREYERDILAVGMAAARSNREES